MPHTIRPVLQQLAGPRFQTPAQVVNWMGAVQAQEYSMAKWAVGLRTKNPSLSVIERAFSAGEIIRTHILRPTWHFVSPHNIRWMLGLCGARVKRANLGYARTKDPEIDDKLCARFYTLLEKILRGNRLSRAEIMERCALRKFPMDPFRARRLLECAECDGIICGGAPRGREHTYVLLEERVPPAPELSEEESLAKLAEIYFRSRGPASQEDFVWWSGLTAGQARMAREMLRGKLNSDFFGSTEMFWLGNPSVCPAETVHLLPSFDEYLIAYKTRAACLDEKHFSKAFNRFGIFYPVLFVNGRIVGNWRKILGRHAPELETSFFVRSHGACRAALEAAQKRYLDFLAG